MQQRELLLTRKENRYLHTTNITRNNNQQYHSRKTGELITVAQYQQLKASVLSCMAGRAASMVASVWLLLPSCVLAVLLLLLGACLWWPRYSHSMSLLSSALASTEHHPVHTHAPAVLMLLIAFISHQHSLIRCGDFLLSIYHRCMLCHHVRRRHLTAERSELLVRESVIGRRQQLQRHDLPGR